MAEKERAVVLLSGGMDSTYTLWKTAQEYEVATCVFFNYGQKHLKHEHFSARAITRKLGYPLQEVVLPIYYNLPHLSALTQTQHISGTPHRLFPDLPESFVPFRNLMFITHAAVVALALDATVIALGATQVDYSGYPDCREPFFTAAEIVLNIALGLPDSFKIYTPALFKKKAEMVKEMAEAGVLDLIKHSYSCYNGVVGGCGYCPACTLRIEAFKEAGVEV